MSIRLLEALTKIVLSQGGVPALPAPPTRDTGSLYREARSAALRQLKEMEGGVIVIIGMRGSGKTKLAQRLAQFIGRPIYGVSPEEKLPRWIQEVTFENISGVPPGSTLILDDIPVYASSRDYNMELVRAMEKIIPTVRHRNTILIFVTQSSAMADKYILDADAVFIKPLSVLFEDLERSGVKKLGARAMALFATMTESQKKRYAYMVTHTFKGMVQSNLPKNNSGLPKGHRGIKAQIE